ncbi:hypothetical protein PoB_002315300 [Plakobranchus ocellatus]|uniref:Uncharacterized protein n=1 Tax=Plakobranchus ocellatus TaxID=259542 RepID=A0AAV3ZP87_9GAST|nr:hypothetical protein PoB_002315300 [Plakobranchus ocellatus]
MLIVRSYGPTTKPVGSRIFSAPAYFVCIRTAWACPICVCLCLNVNAAIVAIYAAKSQQHLIYELYPGRPDNGQRLRLIARWSSSCSPNRAA